MATPLTVSVLLARGGSKGVADKNLRAVGGLSLVARSVLAARSAENVRDVYVSTDSPRIAEEAARYGARVVERPADLAGDTASSESGWLHALAQIKREHPAVARLVFLQCTSPFTTGADIDRCLDAMERANASCSLSVIPDHSFLWTLDANGAGRGLNHDETKQRPRRQDLPPQFRESGAIYCARVEDFERVGRRFCGPVALCPVDHPPIEIDNLADLDACNALASKTDTNARHEKIANIRAVVMDFDGVHTDDSVIVDQNGVESVRVSRRDGLGVEMLRKDGKYRLLILSKERNPVVTRRAEKLGVECLQAEDDKVTALERWMATEGLQWSQIMYVGNDVNDAGPLSKAGFSACPSDAHPNVLPLVDWFIPHRGGHGAVRAIADLLLG